MIIIVMMMIMTIVIIIIKITDTALAHEGVLQTLPWPGAAQPWDNRRVHLEHHLRQSVPQGGTAGTMGQIPD